VEREHFDEWALSLAPSPDLLSSYRDGKMDWPSFKCGFKNELRKNVASIEAILALNHISKSQNVTPLCYEKSGVACHRHIVRGMVESPELLEPQEHRSQFVPEHTNNGE